MLNDQADKYDGDDTEYHFSDEEINYDVDASESPKATPVSADGGASGIGTLLRSRRLLISAVVFIALVLVVYKMVTPSSSEPDVNVANMKPATSPVILHKDSPTKTVSPAAAKPAFHQRATVATTQPVAQPKPVQPVAPATTAVKSDTQTVQMPGQVASAAKPQAPAYQQQNQAYLQQLEQAQQPTQAAQPAQPVARPQAAAPQQPANYNMPIMPSGPATYDNQASVQQVAPVANQQYAVPGASQADAHAAALAAQNERLLSQLETQYDQRIKDYQAQNKTLQDELQTLNSKVASMESKFSEVMQGLPKKHQASPAKPQSHTAAPPVVHHKAEPAPRLGYDVQAIIPGRAWLKAANGETLTVAEGDIIKGIGRVTKIDPYDGVVEINTGKRVVALSYGDGG